MPGFWFPAVAAGSETGETHRSVLNNNPVLELGDLTTMALFVEVVELRSFTRAAATSGMAKATVSRRIADLERRLGVRLLQRTTRQVTPTEEGKRLIRDAAILGLGVASLPSHVVAEEVRAGRLVRVLERARLPELPINIVYPERTLPARARKLVEFLIDRFTTRRWRERALLV